MVKWWEERPEESLVALGARQLAKVGLLSVLVRERRCKPDTKRPQIADSGAGQTWTCRGVLGELDD